MGNLFSALFDFIILSGVVTFILGWILGECDVKLSERGRGFLFVGAFCIFVLCFFLGALPPLPRIW